MFRRAIVCIHDVAGRAAAAAIVTRLVVGTRQREQRIEQAGLLEAEKNGVGAKKSAETAFAELVVRASGFFLTIGVADFAFFLAAAFKNTQHVAGLRYFPALERSEFWKNSFQADFVGSGGRDCADSLRDPGRRVALAEARIFQWERTVIVKRRTPKHRSVRHHAGFYFQNFRRVTPGCATCLCGDSQVSRIDEADVLVTFAQPFCVQALLIP